MQLRSLGFDEILDNASYGTSRGTGMVTLTPFGWKIEQYALTFQSRMILASSSRAKIKAFETKGSQ